MIDSLPNPPSRLTGYATFIVDVPLFLDALTPFTQDVNNLSNEIETYKPNKWCMGSLGDDESFPEFSVYTGNPTGQQKPSVTYVTSLDTENFYYKNYSDKVNDTLGFFGKMLGYRGAVDNLNYTFNQLDNLSSPPTRSMSESQFNSNALGFSLSMSTHTQSIVNLKMQWESFLNDGVSCGRVTDATISENISCGRVTDTILEN